MMSQAKTAIQEVRALLEAAPLDEENRTPQEMRESINAMTGAFPVPEDAKITEAKIGGVAGEWMDRAGVDSDHLVLYFHGGGYVIGSPKTHRALTAKLGMSAGARVFAADYRMGPENPFPAAVEDAFSAYKGLIDKEGFDPSKTAISGDSAGGGLTMALLVKLRDEGIPLPKCAALLSPWVDLTGDSPTLTSLADRDPIVQKESLLQLAGWYLGGADAKNPLASPLFANLKNLPPLLIHVGTDETLLDDSKTLHKNAKKAGVPSEIEIWDDMIHVWHAFHFILPEGAEALDKIGAFMKRHWGRA